MKFMFAVLLAILVQQLSKYVFHSSDAEGYIAYLIAFFGFLTSWKDVKINEDKK